MSLRGDRSAGASRPPAVAGMFYPFSTDELGKTVDDLLAETEAPEVDGRVKGVIAPHAGYIYSGPTAAAAFKALARDGDAIERIVLLGPAHRVAFHGVAAPASDAFLTPLGAIPVASEAISGLMEEGLVIESRDAHRDEHSLEVELPFLQRLLDRFEIVPLVVGLAASGEVARVIERLWDGPATRFVISSDLSHYLAYEQAMAMDQETAEAILAFSHPLPQYAACGAMAIDGWLPEAEKHGLVPRLLDLRNSGDTAGDRQRVVGYAAVAFVEPEG